MCLNLFENFVYIDDDVVGASAAVAAADFFVALIFNSVVYFATGKVMVRTQL